MVSCSRQLVQLTDRCSATLVIASHDETCGSIWLRGEQHPFRSGDILLANAGDVQKILPAARPSAYFTIYWERAVLERAASAAGFADAANWSAGLMSARPAAVELARLRDLLESGADAEAVEAAFAAATAEVLGAAANNRETARTVCHPGVRRAALHAGTSLSESLSLEQMASEVRMSKCHLVRCFQHAMGVPPHRYRTLLRLQHARRLLENGHSVAEVADQTGFADAPHLTRSFRDWLGVSPAAWGNAWRASNPWTSKPPKTMPPPMLSSSARR